MDFLKTTDQDFAAKFSALVNNRRESRVDVSVAVQEIIANVKVSGDEAIREYTSCFDNHSPTSFGLSQKAITYYAQQCSADITTALEFAAERITAFHQKQVPQNFVYTDSVGVNLSLNWVPLSTVG
ncbi:histidinol dehydrogenase, partial [Richelia intracellularis]|uniref:histidinol dehydrogenase n=1 Tax=Richelia intracellularis TaxID=1164990 RepID=UPI0005C490F4